MRGTSLLIPVGLLGSLLLYKGTRRVWRVDQQETEESLNRVSRGSLWGLAVIVVTVMSRTWFHHSFGTYLPAWIQGQGGAVLVGGQILFTFKASVGVGSLIGGGLSDRLGRWQVMAFTLIGLAPAVWLVPGVSSELQIGLVIFIGVLLGMTFPTSIAMAQEVWPAGRGVASGLVLGLPWIAGGTGALVTGRLADRFSMAVALRSLAVPALLGTGFILVYWLLRRPRGLEPRAEGRL
jgi:FSR family fosmidomycin resistance protein-like MFS transporter